MTASLANFADAARSGGPIPARAGIGLRFAHHDLVVRTRPQASWFEVHPENYLGHGSAFEALAAVRRDYPVSLHATGLSLGSAEGIDADHLAAVAELARRIEPGLVSDHLSWSAAGGLHLPDLLPLPYTGEALAVVARNVDQAQDVFGRRLLIENPSTYLAFAAAEMGEGAFLGELVRRTGCGVLLDVNNVFVSASNLGVEPAAALSALLDAAPAEAIGEIHLAGHAVRALPERVVIRIDDHGSPVAPEVWELFASAVDRLGPRPTLIEWDTDVPAFGILQGEAALADGLLQPRVRRHVAAR